MLVLHFKMAYNRSPWLLAILVSLCSIAFVRCVNVKNFDLAYEPTTSKAPRAVLVDQNNNPISSLATNAFTICLFVKLHDDGFIIADLFSYSSRKADEISEIVMESDCNEKYTDFFIHGTRTTFEAVPPFDEWTHVCVSWESNTGNARFYLNGQQTGGTRRLEQGYEIGGDGVFVLGQRQNDYNDDFDPDTGVRGVIGRFNLWNRVLTQVEVQQVLNCKLEGNVVGWSDSQWKLYDGLRLQTPDDTCGMKSTPLGCTCDRMMDQFRSDFLNSTSSLQTQINELQQKMNAINIGSNGDLGKEVIRNLQDKYEKCENEINNLKRRNDVYEVELNNIKPKISQYDLEIQSLKEKIAVFEQTNHSPLDLSGLRYLTMYQPVFYGQKLAGINPLNFSSLPSTVVVNKGYPETTIKYVTGSKDNEVKPDNDCPQDFTNIGSGCYYFSTDAIQDWDEALKKCQSMDPSSTLITLESKEKWVMIEEYMRSDASLADKSWWIGGSILLAENQWKWGKNGEPFSFTDWCSPWPFKFYNGGSGRYCAFVRTKLRPTTNRLCWNYNPCTTNDPNNRIIGNWQRRFICERQ